MSTKRVLVVGSNGLLGQKVTELLVRGSSYDITLSSRAEVPMRELHSTRYVRMDLTSRKEVKTVIHSVEPDFIINCAAMTNVDACEKEKEGAWRINTTGVENLIDAAKKNDATIFHISTDYVFDGKDGPYDEEARPNPLSYYGKTKLASENALRVSGLPFFIARTMVLYGYEPGVKPNFALWLVQSLEKKLPVRVVDDQLGNPTLVDDLAHGILSAIELGRTGVYHLAGRDIMSRYDFALTLARVFEFDPALITPIQTSLLRQPAPRPLKSGLVTLKAEVELAYRPSTAEHGLRVLKSQLSRLERQMADSKPIPGSSASKPQKR